MTSRLRISHFAPIWLAIIVDSMGYGLVYPTLTLIFTSGTHPLLPPTMPEAMRHFYLGLGYLLYPMAMFFGAPLISDFSDRFGRRNLLLIAMGGVCCGFLLMGLGVTFNSLALLLLGRAVSGLFAGSQPTAQATIADMSTPEEKKRNMSVMSFVISIGIIIGPIIGGFFADNKVLGFFSFSTPFYFASLLAGGVFLWIYAQFSETFPAAPGGKIDILRPIKIYGDLGRENRLLFLTVVFLLMQIGFGVFYQLIQVRMAIEFDYSAWHLGLFNTAIGLSFAIAIYLSMRFLLKVTHEENLLTWTLILTGLGITTSCFVYHQGAILLLAILAAGFDMIAYSMIMACFSHSVSPLRQGFAMGIFGATLALSWTIAGFATNLLTLMRIESVILIGGLSLLLAGALMFCYKKQEGAKF